MGHRLQQGFFMYAKRAMPHGALVAISLADRHMRMRVQQAVVTEIGRMAESRADCLYGLFLRLREVAPLVWTECSSS
jgi:hypothetical protein